MTYDETQLDIMEKIERVSAWTEKYLLYGNNHSHQPAYCSSPFGCSRIAIGCDLSLCRYVNEVKSDAANANSSQIRSFLCEDMTQMFD